MSMVRALALVWLLIHSGAALAQEQAQEVKVGFYISSLSNINFADGSFRISGDAWFVHQPDAFDPVKQIEIAARTSGLDPVSRERLPDGRQYDWTRIQAVVDHDFTYSLFPFDRHRLSLVLEAQDPVDHVRLVADTRDTRVGDLVAITVWDVTGWQLDADEVRYDTDFGYPGKELRTYSRLILTIEIARQRSALVIDKFLGFTMAFLVSMLVYLVRTDQFGVRAGTCGGAIFAVVGNRASLEALLGSDNRIGLVDQLTLIVFGSILTSLLVSMIVFYLRDEKDVLVARRVNQVAGLTSLVVFPLLAVLAVMRANSGVP